MEKRRHTLKVRENFSRAARSVPVYTSRKLSGRANTSLIGENCNRLAEKTVSTRASYSVACSLSQRHPPRQTASRPQNKPPTQPGYPQPPPHPPLLYPTPSFPRPALHSTNYELYCLSISAQRKRGVKSWACGSERCLRQVLVL